jgi:hypothetical protein
LIPGLDRLEPFIDRLGTLEVQDRYRRPVVLASRIKIGDPTRYANRGGAFKREQSPGCRARVRRGLRMPDRWSMRKLEHTIVTWQRSLARTRGWRKHRKDAPAHSTPPHARKIEVAASASGGEPRVVMPRERVVVSIEHGQHTPTLLHAAVKGRRAAHRSPALGRKRAPPGPAEGREIVNPRASSRVGQMTWSKDVRTRQDHACRERS